MDLLGRSDAALALAASVRDFVDREVIPRESPALAHDVAGLDALAAELRPLAMAAGIYGPRLAADLGGLELGWRDAQPILEAAGRSPLGPMALNCAPPDGPNADLLARLATPAQRERWLEPLADGSVRSCFAMTEPAPGAGSDPKMLASRAERVEGGWRLTGHKWFISGAEGASIAIVLARAPAGPSLFLVETGNPGWQHVRTIASLDGFQLGGHGEIRLDDCVVDDDALLGEEGRAFHYAQARLEPARLAHCMRFIGRAARALEIAERYVLERESFGHPLGDHQLVQGLVADAHMDLEASRLMTWQVAARLDAGESVAQISGMAKVFVAEALERVVDRAIQLMGARGIAHDTPVAGFSQELRAFRIYDGASEVHRAAIGRRFLKAADPGAR